jgi:hypothetical protein
MSATEGSILKCPKKGVMALGRCLEWQAASRAEGAACTCAVYLKHSAELVPLPPKPKSNYTTMSRMRCAATRIGIPVEEYLQHRAAGEAWCCGCRKFHPQELVTSGGRCNASMRAYDAARYKLQRAAR